MVDTEWLAVDSILMTSEPIAAYGGIAMPSETLESLAASLRSTGLRMHLDHDLSRPLRVRNPKVWVEERADGVHLLRMAYEIHRDDFELAGQRRGMSTTIHSPLPGRSPQAGVQDPLLALAADSAWFEYEALLLAEDALKNSGVPGGRMRVERAYQFSAVPDPQVFVTVIPALVMGLGTGLLGNMLWDGIKLLFQKRKTPKGGSPSTPTTVNLQLTDGERSLTGVVQTASEEVAGEAIVAFEAVARQFIKGGHPSPRSDSADSRVEQQVVTWNDSSSGWSPPR